MPILSILIPTKSNAATIRSTVDTARAVAISDAEIVVQDCGSTDDTEREIRNIADDRLRYYRSPPGISMTENWNAGINHCHGDYICIVGADDGVSPYLAEAVAWAVRNNISAIVPSFGASYAWPRADRRGGETAGVLTMGTSYTGAISCVSARGALEAYCRTGADYGESLKLPSLYRCLVSRTLLNKLREYLPYYIAGTAPDIYSSVALGRVAANWVHLDYPLFLPGWAAESNTASAVLGQFDKDLARNSHIKEYCNLRWPSSVPEFASPATLVAESTLLALADLDCVELLREFNYYALYTRYFIGTPRYWRATWKCLSSLSRSPASGPGAVAATARLGWEVARYCCRCVRSGVQNRLKKRHAVRLFSPVQTVEQAVETLRLAVPQPRFH
jgi:glycosyltransferase involved in cell wall biosynthesis